MEPFAHGLRDHEIFRTPNNIDRSASTRQLVPSAWSHAIPDKAVDVLPLADKNARGISPGWCTYVYEHEQAPELEVLCGGINAKTPKAGGLWRQGNLLHFGFDLSPAQMNDNGRALMVNSICYISRFVDDRPILQTPSVFYSGRRIVDRGVIARLLAREDRDPAQLKYWVSAESFESIDGKDREQISQWYEEIRDYLHADDNGKLTVDEETRRFGASPASKQFLNSATAALNESGERREMAKRLLTRYVPDGPGADASADAWQAWLDAHRPYLFFSDSGGYRWYIDPLAQSRGVRTDSLRGPSRASRARPVVAK